VRLLQAAVRTEPVQARAAGLFGEALSGPPQRRLTPRAYRPRPGLRRDAQRQWREAHPDYQRHYRQSHPESVDENRRRQSQRDERRRIGNLVKNNLAFDLTPSVSKVLLIGPAAADLDKNNLAQSKLLIYRTLEAASSLQAAS
jgi:hypothetical protein